MMDDGCWILDDEKSTHRTSGIEIAMRANAIIPILQFAICILQFAICNSPGGGALCRAEQPSDPRTWYAENSQSLLTLYRHLHQTPELSLREEQTAARMAQELRDVGATVTTGVGGYGVVGVLENGPGKVLMLRADLDALPVAELTGLAYASQVRTKDERGATVGARHAPGR